MKPLARLSYIVNLDHRISLSFRIPHSAFCNLLPLPLPLLPLLFPRISLNTQLSWLGRFRLVTTGLFIVRYRNSESGEFFVDEKFLNYDGRKLVT